MTFGNEQASIRKPRLDDLDSIKKLADQHKHELGFILRPALQYSIEKSEMFVAVDEQNTIQGFVHYRHRKDGQTTLYSIIVEPKFQGYGIGKRLIESLQAEVMAHNQRVILLKCPLDLDANRFYENCGFVCSGCEKGKHRTLQIWVLHSDTSAFS